MSIFKKPNRRQNHQIWPPKRVLQLPLTLLCCLAAISMDQAQTIGSKVWQNECGGRVSGLVAWNEGEEFASLGIGHFIWFPEGYRGPFTETFPDLIRFLQARGCAVPAWAKGANPWATREAFLAARESAQVAELRRLLEETVALQALFIADRLERYGGTRGQLERLLKTPQGLYAVIDYLNFKGEGTLERERYQGEGWGLLQVLEGMESGEALEAFVASAKRVLKRRVELSPPARREERWLPGWTNRVDSYLKPFSEKG